MNQRLAEQRRPHPCAPHKTAPLKEALTIFATAPSILQARNCSRMTGASRAPTRPGDAPVPAAAAGDAAVAALLQALSLLAFRPGCTTPTPPPVLLLLLLWAGCAAASTPAAAA